MGVIVDPTQQVGMDKSLAQKIGVAARAARASRGLTQQEAAEEVGVSPEFYARIERGLTLPSVPTLTRLSDALQTSTDVLLGRGGPQPAKRTTSTLAAHEPPELRRLIRRVRTADPTTVRLLNLMAAALKR